MTLFEEVLNYFGVVDDFILNIPAVKNYVQDKGIDNDTYISLLLDIYHYNNNLLSKLEQENDVFKSIDEKRNIPLEIKDELNNDIVDNNTKIDDSKNNSIMTDISYYMDIIENIKDTNTLSEILPTKDTKNWETILNLIMCELHKRIKTWNTYIYQDQSLTKEELDYIKETVNTFKDFNEYIIDYRDELTYEDEEIIQPADNDITNNNLIFLKSSSFHPYIYSDIGKNKDSYHDLLDAFISFKNNTFKIYKKFNHNSNLQGLIVIRNNYVRIIYKQITKDTYLVVHTIPYKNYNISSEFRTTLFKRNHKCEEEIKHIKEILNNPEQKEIFLKENEDIYNEITSILSNNNKTKKKGSDINGIRQ